MTANTLRLEVRAKNNVLWQAIHTTAPSVVAFCLTHDLNREAVSDLLLLRRPPWRVVSAGQGKGGVARRDEPTAAAARLCEVTGLEFRELFPPDLYESGFGRPAILETDPKQFRSLAAARHLALPAPQEGQILTEERHAALSQALHTLTEREQLVIEKLYGLGEHDEHTLQAVGDELGFCRENVRRIQARALKKLRHPARKLERVRP